MKSNVSELFRTVLHFFLPECIDSCANHKAQEVTKWKNSASDNLLQKKSIQTFCKETQTDNYFFSYSGPSLNAYSVTNSDVHQEKYMEEKFQCCSEFTSIGCFDLDQNNNQVTFDEVESSHHLKESFTLDEKCDHCINANNNQVTFDEVESSHHLKESFTLDEKCCHCINAGTDMVCQVQTEYGSTESVNVMKNSSIPFVYDLYELPVLVKDSDYNKESISSQSTVDNVPDNIVLTTWSYSTINGNDTLYVLTDESLAHKNIYTLYLPVQDNTDSWAVHWPHDNLDEKMIFLNSTQCLSLVDNVAEATFAENDIYFEDDYLQDYNPKPDSVPELILDFESFLNTPKNIEELIQSSDKEMAVNVSSLRKSCRQKHYSTSDVPCHKNVIITCCRETQTDESCFDTSPDMNMSFDPFIGLQIAFECSTVGSTLCVEDSIRNSFNLRDRIST